MKKNILLLIFTFALLSFLMGCASVPTIPAGKKIQAEEFSEEEGTQPEKGGGAVGYIDSGDYFMYKNVDFGAGVSIMRASVANNSGSRHLILRLDSLEGPEIGVLAIESTFDWNGYEEMSCEIKGAKGIHDLYFVAMDGETEIGNIDWFVFE
ncbi:MAG: carbohydrate-binding protein [Spirochaetales bacterium]|nr:carbohydrate-binding protein [Spirochaetales bacterium]